MRGWNSTLPTRRERPRRAASTPMAGEGAAVLHPGNFRSRSLLDLAADCPHCMHCDARNVGQVVGCHSNSLEDGKGMGLKAHDLPAFLCGDCHDLLDGRTGNLTRFEKSIMFLRAAYRSMVWMLQSGKLTVAA